MLIQVKVLPPMPTESLEDSGLHCSLLKPMPQELYFCSTSEWPKASTQIIADQPLAARSVVSGFVLTWRGTSTPKFLSVVPEILYLERLLLWVSRTT